MSEQSRGNVLAIGCGGLLAAGAVMAVAGASTWLGVALVVLACGATGAVLSGRFPAVPRRAALGSVAVATFAVVGTMQGMQRRSAEEARLAEAAAAAAASAAHTADVRAHAPETLAQAGAALDGARAAIEAGHFADAVTAAESVGPMLGDVRALDPVVDGADALAIEATSVRSEAVGFLATQTAIDAARDATEPGADDDLVAWDDDLQVLADSLDAATPAARTRFGDRLTEASQSIARLRARFHTQVARARRELELAERNVERAARDLYAQQLDARFIHEGIEVQRVEAAGRDGTTLRIRYVLCGRVFLDRLAGEADTQASLRRLGFTRIECRSGFDSAWIDLGAAQ